MSAPRAVADRLAAELASSPLRLEDERGNPCEVPRLGRAALLVFYRGDWCPWCNGQLASLARELEAGPAADADVWGVSVDPPERCALMRVKLRLPFPLLSDRDGREVERLGLGEPGVRIARPAVVVVDRSGAVCHTAIGGSFAERAPVAALIERLAVAS